MSSQEEKRGRGHEARSEKRLKARHESRDEGEAREEQKRAEQCVARTKRESERKEPSAEVRYRTNELSEHAKVASLYRLRGAANERVGNTRVNNLIHNTV